MEGVGGGINVSSLLQIRRRLKSQRNPRGNPGWFEGLLVELGPAGEDSGGWKRT